MPEYKLIYFNGTGRGELIRFIFAYAGIKYTDERVAMADWPARKPNIPGNRLPVLMVGDKPLPQSLAQARFAAREAGLIPENSLDAAYCDALVDTIEELHPKFFDIMFSNVSDAEKKKQYQDLLTNKMTPFFTRLNKRLTGKQWFVSDKLTWADLAIANAALQFKAKIPNAFDAFPVIDSHVKKVLALPKIKEYIDKRPKKTDF